MTSRMLERIKLKGYATFRELDLALAPINVLIGANGAGKSNLIALFTMLNQMMNEALQLYVARAGGADRILHYGRKTTEQMEVELWFADHQQSVANGYRCELVPVRNELWLRHESTYFHDRANYPKPLQRSVSDRLHSESFLPQWAVEKESVDRHVYRNMNSWRRYHFHDTGPTARVKQPCSLRDWRFLHADAANLATFLFHLRAQHQLEYRAIIETIRLAAPFFGDFVLEPQSRNSDQIMLEWRERGSDFIFGPDALSDGTLRFICLATLFLQPERYLPATIVIDEPELGLHPYAITLLAELVRKVATKRQVILATQSVALVNQFAPEEVLVVDRRAGVSTVRRLDSDILADWLADYALGELWEKNVLGGRPQL